MKIERRHKFALSGAFCVLWLTGAVWLALHHFGNARPGSSVLVTKVWFMTVHGLAAFVALLLLGTLSEHVQSGLAGYTNRRSGMTLIVVSAVLVLSGWLLYYAGESVRSFASQIHLVVGVLSPVLLVVHLRGRR